MRVPADHDPPARLDRAQFHARLVPPAVNLDLAARPQRGHDDGFAPDESLEVSAVIIQRVGRLASLVCEVRSAGELVAKGTLSVFIPDHLPGLPGAAA